MRSVFIDGVLLLAALGAGPPASAAAADARPRPRIEFDLTADRIDLAALLAARPAAPGGSVTAAGAPEGIEPGAAPEGDGPRESARIFSPAPLPFARLRGIDAVLNLRAKAVVTGSVTFTDVEARLDLARGRLRVDPMRGSVGGGTVTGTLEIDARSPDARVTLRLSAAGVDAGRLLPGSANASPVEGKVDADLRGSGRGASVAAILASLDGEVRLLMDGGRARTGTLDRWVAGIRSLMKLPTGERSEWTALNCAAAAFEIKAGIATSRVLLLDSARVTIAGRGTIDLGRERIDLKLTPRPKSTTLNVSVPVNVGGTLADPTYSPDKLAAARRLGGLLGAALFPPAALAAFADLGTGNDRPCLSVARGAGAGPEPAPPASAVDQVRRGAKSAIERIGKGLGKLMGR